MVVPQRRAGLAAFVVNATTLVAQVVELDGGTLISRAGFDGHQGVGLVVGPRSRGSLQDLLARAVERREPTFALVLDSLEDPQNLGTLLRSAEACGVHGVIYPTRRAAPLTPAAVKASAGAVEHLLLVPVDDLAGALVELHSRGLRIVGADAEAPLSYREADFRGPLALVVGSEGRGVSGTVRRRLDLAVRIPMAGRVASLNAAVAGSILLFEAAAQRGESGRGWRAQPAEASGVQALETPAAESRDASSVRAPEAPAVDAATTLTLETGDPGTGEAADELPVRFAETPEPEAPEEPTRAPEQDAPVVGAAGDASEPPRRAARRRRTAPPPAEDSDLLPGAPPPHDPT